MFFVTYKINSFPIDPLSVDEVRKSMRVSNGCDVLLALAWITGKEISMLERFPEVLFADVTECTNKERRGMMGMAIFSMLYTATCQMSSHSSTRTPGKAIVFSLLLKPIPTRVPFSTWYLKSRTCPTYGAKVSNFSSEPKTVIKNEKIGVRMKN